MQVFEYKERRCDLGGMTRKSYPCDLIDSPPGASATGRRCPEGTSRRARVPTPALRHAPLPATLHLHRAIVLPANRMPMALPHNDFTPHTTVYYCFAEWTRRGILDKVNLLIVKHSRWTDSCAGGFPTNIQPIAAVIDSYHWYAN